MNNEPKLNLDKPLQTRDGREVLEWHEFEHPLSPFRIVALIKAHGGDAVYSRYDSNGRFSTEKETSHDLINVPEPEPLQFWDCPDDVPKDRPVWMRKKDWDNGECDLLCEIGDAYLRTSNEVVRYEDLHLWQWLDNDVWKECVKQ